MTWNWGSIPDWVTALIAFGALYLAATQLRTIRRTESANFVHKLKSDFFTPQVQRIIGLLERDELDFIATEEASYFRAKDGTRWDTHEVDFYLMLPLENLGALARKKLLDIDLVYDFFSWHIWVVWKSKSIKKYVEWTRSDARDWDVFECLEALERQLREFERRKKGDVAIEKAR